MKFPKGISSFIPFISIPANAEISLSSKLISLSGFNIFTVIFLATVVPINLSFTKQSSSIVKSFNCPE